MSTRDTGQKPSRSKTESTSAPQPASSEMLDEVRLGNKGAVEALIEGGADANATNANGRSLLFIAAINGHPDIVELLLKSGAKASMDKSLQQKTLTLLEQERLYDQMLRAINENEVPFLYMLINFGADVNKASNSGLYPLHLAAAGENLQTVQTLIQAGADLNTPDKNGWTPLFHAVVNSQSNIIDILIQAGASVDITDNRGLPLLHLAVNNTHIVETLINAGADVNKANGEGIALIHIAAKEGLNNVIELLIKSNADIHKPDAGGNTPLHTAAANGHCVAILMLVAAGADINLLARGLTPLHCAASAGHYEAIRTLIIAGADIHKRGKFGWTPIFYAASNGYKTIVDTLINAGVDINSGFGDKNLLTTFIDRGNDRAVDLLIKAGADPNKYDSRGETILASFIGQRKLHAIDRLLKVGADPNKTIGVRNKPLALALYGQQVNTAELLIKAGANANKNEKRELKRLRKGYYNKAHRLNAKTIKIIALLVLLGIAIVAVLMLINRNSDEKSLTDHISTDSPMFAVIGTSEVSPLISPTSTPTLTPTPTPTMTPIPTMTAVPSTSLFQDPGLEEAVRMALGKSVGDINQTELESLTLLNASHMEISDITGIEILNNLITLRLSHNAINDISPISELLQLKYVDLSYNKIDDVLAITKLKNLYQIDLSHNRITSINSLSSNRSIAWLDLSHNRIKNLYNIQLPSLRVLDISNNWLFDVEEVNKYSLDWVDVRYNFPSCFMALLDSTGKLLGVCIALFLGLAMLLLTIFKIKYGRVILRHMYYTDRWELIGLSVILITATFVYFIYPIWNAPYSGGQIPELTAGIIVQALIQHSTVNTFLLGALPVWLKIVMLVVVWIMLYFGYRRMGNPATGFLISCVISGVLAMFMFIYFPF